MIYLPDSVNDEHAAILGVWEEHWRARARLAHQAERYRAWLRQQGCSRDQAADMAVRLLADHEPDEPQPSKALIH